MWALSDGDTAFKVIGHNPMPYSGAAGCGILFNADLWHCTWSVEAPTMRKVAFFYGYEEAS